MLPVVLSQGQVHVIKVHVGSQHHCCGVYTMCACFFNRSKKNMNTNPQNTQTNEVDPLVYRHTKEQHNRETHGDDSIPSNNSLLLITKLLAGPCPTMQSLLRETFIMYFLQNLRIINLTTSLQKNQCGPRLMRTVLSGVTLLEVKV